MSFETLLLLVVFIILPLIEAFRTARRRGGGTPERREGRPPARAPARVETPVRAETKLQTLAEKIAAQQRAPEQHIAAPVERDRAAYRQARRRGTVVGYRESLDLRRAIVLMTILGPCRANSPHDWPERSPRQ